MVFAGQLMVALCFAELAGRFPVAGSVYNWSKRLGQPHDGVAGRLDDADGLDRDDLRRRARPTSSRCRRSGRASSSSATPPTRPTVAVNAVILGSILIIFTTIVNALGVKLMTRINSTGVFIELIAAVLLIIVLLGYQSIVNSHRRCSSTPAATRTRTGGYLGAFLVAALASAYVMYGFDTASSLGEETVDPRRTAPTAILRAVIASFVLGGLILLFAILAAPDLADPAIGERPAACSYHRAAGTGRHGRHDLPDQRGDRDHGLLPGGAHRGDPADVRDGARQRAAVRRLARADQSDHQDPDHPGGVHRGGRDPHPGDQQSATRRSSR